MNSVPEISVVIPTRNRWELLSAHALPSALCQEDVELEVVIVDDASDDGSPARLAEIDDPRIRVVRHETRRRLAGARNTGATAARAPWLAFLDDDDLWSPRKLRAQLDTAHETGADWVYGRAIVVDADKRVIDEHPFPAPDELDELLQGGNHVPGGGSNVILTANVLKRVGGFDEELRYFEDWDLWLRLVHAARAAACSEVVVAHVEHGDNMLFRDGADVAANVERLLGKHREVGPADRRSIIEWVAHEHVRAGFGLRASVLYLKAAVAYRSAGDVVAALGAPFGERGVAAASRLLAATTGRTHLDDAIKRPPATEPPWLALYRSARAR